MEFLKKHLPEYEAMILRREKISFNQTMIIIKTIGILIVLAAVVFGAGWIFNLLQSLGYLFTSSIIVAICTYVTYKMLAEKEYISITEETHPIWYNAAFDSLYMFVTLTSATTFLFYSVYLKALSPFLGIVYIILVVISLFLYTKLYQNIKELDIPGPWQLPINGFFLAILFYSVTMLVQVNNVGLSLVFVFPIIFLIIRLKIYLKKRFRINTNQFAIVFFGLFLIMLSFLFNVASNLPSIYRGEFTFRILYETLINPEKEFPKDVKGEAMFYDDFIVIVDTEEITFYDYDLEVVKSYDNLFDAVYVMNGRLLANKVPGTPTPYIDLFEFKENSFDFIGSYFVSEPAEKVFIEGDSYLPLNGSVYKKSIGSDDYVKLESEGTPSPTIIEQYDDYLVFRYGVPIFASTDSFRDEVQGYIFDNIATSNGHIVFRLSQVFVKRNPLKVDPRDNGKVIVYLADTETYFNDDSVVPASFELPRLSNISHFYYINNHYYLVGYIEYSTGDFNNKILVFDEQGKLEHELVFDGPNFAISDEYIMYGNEDSIKLFALDADTSIRYRLIVGYQTTFTTITLVALFALGSMSTKPKKKI